jgi:hypothetical protein
MARGTRGRAQGPVCTPLEMYVPAPYKIVGTRDWLQNAWEPGAWDEGQIIPVSDPSDMNQVKEFLNKLPVHGIDTETTGRIIKGDKYYSMNPLNPDTRMVLFQIGNEDLVYLIQPELVVELKPWLESASFLHLLHNAIYDFKWLLVKYGIHMQRLFCSMLAEQLLVAGLMAMKVGLADCSRRHAPFWLINKAVRDSFITLDHENRKMSREMAYYSARDIVLMFPLMRDQIAGLKKYQLNTVAQDEFDVIYPTAEMEIEGVTLSLPIMRQIIEYWEQHEIDVSNEIFKIFAEQKKDQGDLAETLIPELSYVFNLTSNAAKLAALKEIDIDLDNIKRESLKEVSKNEKDFTPGQRKLCKLLAEFSNITKMKTTYGQNMVDKINPYTKRWHPRFKQLGSGEEEGRKSGAEDKSTIATGRFSSDAQQFPKPKELFAPVRRPEEVRQVMSVFADQISAIQAQYPQELKEAA